MLTDNINTDQIIPSREMKKVSKIGLADGLFANMRYLDAASGGRTPDPEFILNEPAAKNASILIAANNFGCGSSREHAVWALHEYGIRAIIAESFGSIFFDNCINNGIAPIVLKKSNIAELAERVKSDASVVDIDLQQCQLRADQLTLNFSMDDNNRQMLIEGSSAIDLTLRYKPEIDQFLLRDKSVRPWVYDTINSPAQSTSESAGNNNRD